MGDVTSSAEQAADAAAFHDLPEDLPGLTLDRWDALAAGWKARMSVEVVVGELRQLIDRCRCAESELGRLQVDKWAASEP